MSKKWPVYDSHETASCIHCGGDFGPGYWHHCGYPIGMGAYEQVCSKCGKPTFYDLASDPKPITGTLRRKRQ
jgi:hypothetical protein